MILHLKNLTGSAIAGIVLLTLTVAPTVAQTQATTPAILAQTNPESMNPAQMRQQYQLMMGEMQEMMGKMQQMISKMTPEQIKAHHEQMMHNMQQMMDNMQQMHQMMNQPGTEEENSRMLDNSNHHLEKMNERTK
ncbi:MAG: hypothetical protein D6756_02565 [Cyanobacteria bacterium J083]|nr:MAG: hypothetical protein D6756_02565 [Cyanobacteria bacterium J083]